MPITGIASFWYPVSDWERAKTFYGEMLGLRLNFCNDGAGWAAYSAGSGPPLFLVRRPKSPDSGRGGVVTLSVTALDELLARLKEAGAEIDANVQTGAGVRILTVYDPDGNAIELSEQTSEGE